ncbi:MAG: clostripain-related cysteine peptidase [Promethearchaeota archaeon]
MLGKKLVINLVIIGLLLSSFTIGFCINYSVAGKTSDRERISKGSKSLFEINTNFASINSKERRVKSDASSSTNCLTEENAKLENTTGGKSWTYMLYLDADNNIEGDAIRDFEELERSGGTNEDINVIVLFDRIPGYDETHGNWTGSRYYRITEDTSSNTIDSFLLKDLGEADMGNPATLRNFLEYCFQNYSAEHYCLDLWDHGWGAYGICADETSESQLTANEIQAAIVRATTTFSTEIDIVSMDACDMNTLEIAWELRDLCDYFIASEDLIYFDGYNYMAIIQGLHRNPSISPKALCELMVNEYQKSYSSTSYTCLSVIDQRNISNILPVINNFIEEISYAISELDYDFMLYIARMRSYDFFEGAFVDLYDFAEKIRCFFDLETVRLAAAELIAFLEKLIVYNWQHSSSNGGAHGLSIFMPFTDSSYTRTFLFNYANQVGFVFSGMDWLEDSQWDEFVEIYRLQGLYGSPPYLFFGESTNNLAIAQNDCQVFMTYLWHKTVYEFNCTATYGDVDIQVARFDAIGNITFVGESSLINPDDGITECCRFLLRTPDLYYIIVLGRATMSTFRIEFNKYSPRNLACNVPQTASGGTCGGDGNGHFIQDLPHYFRVELPKGNYSIILSNSVTTNYQLTVYDELWTELFYRSPAGFGQIITLDYNNTSEQPIVFILEIIGFEGAGAFTIEVSETHTKTARMGTAFLSPLLLAGIFLVAAALNLRRVLRKRVKLV